MAKDCQGCYDGENLWERPGGRGMNNRENNRRRGRYNSNVLLLTVMIGFCILAIIEIIYGQAQVRLQKERMTLEQENHDTVQELKAEWDQLKGDPNVGTEEPATAGEEQVNTGETGKTLTNTESTQDATEPAPATDNGQQTISQNAPDEKQYDMQIVFMGDSILDHEREDHGVASLISDACNAKVYNMSMGGTTAALLPGEMSGFENWDSRSLLGLVHAIRGEISTDIFNGYNAEWILKECDFDKTDYFVIEYGINDFLTRKIPQSKYLANGDTLDVRETGTYSGALQTAVTLLHERFPNAKILLIAPHFCQFFDADKFIGDAYSVDYGYGTLVEFSRCTGYVYEQNKDNNVLFYNAMEESGIDAYNADRYLEDGVHLTAEGRKVYADYAIRLIMGDFYPQE